MASLTIRPGSHIRLKGQDSHVPDFLVVRCDRDLCWIRQHGWSPEAQLTVRFTQILVPEANSLPSELRPGVAEATTLPSGPPDNVIYLDDYRHRKAR